MNEMSPEGGTTLTQAQVRSEIDEYLQFSLQRRRLFPRAALVGLLAGALAIAFRAALMGADALRNALIGWAHHFPSAGWIFPLLFGAVGASLSVLLVRRFAPEASGSGIPHLEAVLHRFRELDWRRVLPVKFFGGVLALGSGLALGREGPTVQMGGAVGGAVAETLNSPVQERLTLIAAGAGAGLAAAFNAPLSGLVFVLEEVQKDFRQAVFGAAFVAAAVADILARFASGQVPVFSIPAYAVPALSALPIFAVLGVLCGLLGVLFNRSLLATLDLYAKVSPRWRVLLAGAVGAILGVAGWFSPLIVGGGHGLTESILRGELTLISIALLFALRFVFTMGSYGTGAPGGIFAPFLALGALIGLGMGIVAHRIAPGVIPIPQIFAVVGMAAYFTAIIRAPLTGIVLIIEMTGNYAQMLPLLVACFCAYAVTERLGSLPLYESLLERDLLQGGSPSPLEEALVLEVEVEPNSLFADKLVRELGLPPGVLMVRCWERGREWVPTAGTRLEPHVRITVVISPEAPNGQAIVREGCASQD